MRLRAVAVLALTSACATLWWETSVSSAQLDDAYISYRYARNLVRGLGLVYNPGEYVEGFTNFLWTLLIAGGIAADYEAPAIGHGLGIACGMCSLLSTTAYATRFLGRATLTAAFGPWTVLSFAGFPIWAASGMETPLFAAAVTATLAADAVGRPWCAAAFAVLSCLTRPEGALVGACIWFSRFVHEGYRSRNAAPVACATLVTLGLLTVFRLWYFGSPLPNTFHAKVGGVTWRRGVLYVWEFYAAGAVALLPAILLAARENAELRAGVLLAAVVTAYTVAVGGDVFSDSRFMVPILPALVAIAARGAHRWVNDRSLLGGVALAGYVAAPVWFFTSPATGVFVWVVVSVVLVARDFATGAVLAGVTGAVLGGLAFAAGADPGIADVTHPISSSGRYRTVHRTWSAFRFVHAITEQTGRTLRDVRPPIRLLACGGIGVIGYVSDLPIVDYVGLVTREVALSRRDANLGDRTIPGHQRSNADYVLARKPDVILMPQDLTSEVLETPVPAVHDLLRHPELRAHYEFRSRPWAAWWRVDR